MLIHVGIKLSENQIKSWGGVQKVFLGGKKGVVAL